VQKKIKDLLRIPLFFAAFVLLGLTFGFITFKILSFSRTVDVPNLADLTLLEANETLNRAGLYLKIEGEDFDASVPTGRILRQDIPPGNKVKEKRAIKVVVSKGPRVYSVPLLVDHTVGDASDLLVQKGLRIGKIISVHSDYMEKGTIVAQKPEPDERLTDTITVLVSLGPHELTYYCPDFLNRNLEEAKETAEKIGLLIETRGSGSVIRAQRPKAGTPVKSGDKIYFETKEENIND
jgi:beta-lactam-binding protein with PASTA domain